MHRRDLFMLGSATAVAALLPAWLRSQAEEFEVQKTDAEWRRLLTPAQYQVLRRDDTESPGSSPLLDEHRKGVFVCAGCALPLFKSETKFDSGTGWPRFWSPIRGAGGTTGERGFGVQTTRGQWRRR